MRRYFLLLMIVLLGGALFASRPALAADTCVFTDTGSALILQGDCTTDTTILIPDGYVLDGNGYTITAVDPTGDHFRGAVVANGGASAQVTNLTVTTSGLANACDTGGDRLRGIMFEGASGTITGNRVAGINQGASGCQEGNGIEVRNAPFDGTHPDTQAVEVTDNVVVDYQKTGIVANGDVNASIEHNEVGASVAQHELAANGIQLGFGALGTARFNRVEGNQWYGFDEETSNYAGTAILIFEAGEANVSRNNIRGNADIGLSINADGGVYDNNRIFDEGADGGGYDIGIDNLGANTITKNKVRGYETPFVGVSDGGNRAIPAP